VGFTVPAAVWLYGQGPKKGVHHPEAAHAIRDEAEKEEEEPAEEAPEDKQEGAEDKEASDSDQSKDESSDEKSEDSGDDSKQEAKEEGKDESKDQGKDESKDDSDSKGADGKPERKFSDDGYELPGPNAPGQINKAPEKGPGEQQQQVGDRPRTPTQREKSVSLDDTAPRSTANTMLQEGQNRSQSGAMNPYLDDDEKSKKGAGPKETAKIHGTVDSRQPAR